MKLKQYRKGVYESYEDVSGFSTASMIFMIGALKAGAVVVVNTPGHRANSLNQRFLKILPELKNLKILL